MPFGPYTDFKDCVSKNSDKASPHAFCAWLQHSINKEWPGKMEGSMPQEAWDVYLPAYAQHLGASTNKIEEAEKQANDHANKQLNDQGWHLSRIGWVKQYSAPKFRTVMNVRIFASGTWTDSAGVTRVWTDAEVDGLVKAFESGVPAIVPLKAGHTPDAFNQQIAEKLGVPVELVTGDQGKGQISIGRMATLERRGTLLMASLSVSQSRSQISLMPGSFPLSRSRSRIMWMILDQ